MLKRARFSVTSSLSMFLVSATESALSVIPRSVSLQILSVFANAHCPRSSARLPARAERPLLPCAFGVVRVQSVRYLPVRLEKRVQRVMSYRVITIMTRLLTTSF